MIGPIVNSGGLFIGGIIGVIFADVFPERLKKALPSIFGVITLCLGATLVGKAAALPAVTISLILGTMVGEIMYAEALLQKFLRAIFGLLKSKRMGDENFSLMVITLVAAFCFRDNPGVLAAPRLRPCCFRGNKPWHHHIASHRPIDHFSCPPSRTISMPLRGARI